MASQNEQLAEMREQLADIKRYMEQSRSQSEDITELKKKIKFIEERLDDSHPLDLARDFTFPEIKNICIKVCNHHTSVFKCFALKVSLPNANLTIVLMRA
eukprot:541200_1